MRAKDFRNKQKFQCNYFQKLTRTGVDTNYEAIDWFAECYARRCLKEYADKTLPELVQFIIEEIKPGKKLSDEDIKSMINDFLNKTK